MHAAVISVTDASVNGTFAVYDGKIHAVEAIPEQLPIGAPSGWYAPRALTYG